MERSIFRILIADRNPNVLEFLRREFLQEGYRVEVARDGFDVCNVLRASDVPDLVVMDPELPYMDVCGSMDQIGRSYPDLLVVLHYLSRDAPPADVSAKGWAAVEKGGDPARLKSAVRDLLDGREKDRPKRGATRREKRSEDRAE